MMKPPQWKASKSPSDGDFEDADKIWGIPSDATKATVAKLLQRTPQSRRYAVTIVHYHRLEATKELIESIAGWDEPPERILVADNSAPHYDWTFTKASTIPVTVFAFADNPGYGAAINRLEKELEKNIPQFLVLTHEVQAAPSCSRLLLDSMNEVSAVAVSAPILLYKDRPDRIFSLGGRLSRSGVAKHRGLGSRIGTAPIGVLDSPEIHWADGACLMVRRDVFDALRGFDPRFFLYVEEIDYQFRVRLSGGKIWVNRLAIALQNPGSYSLALKYRNHMRFSRKMHPHLEKWPWIRELLKDTLRWAAGRSKGSPLSALKAVREEVSARDPRRAQV